MHIKRDRLRMVKRYVQLEDAQPEILGVEDAFSDVDTALSVGGIEDGKLVLEYYYGQLTIREIAKRHNLTEGACKMRLKRARDKLRKNFHNYVTDILIRGR